MIEVRTKLSAKERTNLRHALRSNPNVLTKVSKLSDISSLSKAALIEAACELGIDIEAAKAGEYLNRPSWDSPEGREQRRRANEKPAFSGSFEEPMTFVLMGRSITRTLRVTYELTPPWRYIDDETGEELQGWEQSSTQYDFLVQREIGLIGSGPGGKARQRREREEWVNCTELFMHEMLGKEFDEQIDDKIEEACLRENQLRKQRFGMGEVDNVIWSFEVGGIVVVCREEQTVFVDPLVHKKDPLVEHDPDYEALVADVEASRLKLTHMVATVTKNGVEIGRASLRDCIRPAIDPAAFASGGAYLEQLLSFDCDISRRFRRRAVQRAISAAREHLKELV